MLKKLTLPVLFTFLFCFAGTVIAQNQTKNRVYEFKVLGLKTQEDALKLNNNMKAKMGVVKSITNFTTQTITVTVDPRIDFQMLRQVVLVSGFEPYEDSMVVKDE